MSASKQERLVVFAALTLVFAATRFAGATVHGGALLLRAVVVVVALCIWPREELSARVRDVVAPLLVLVLLFAALPASPSPGPALQAVLAALVVILAYLALLFSEHDWTGRALFVLAGVGAIHALWALVQVGLGLEQRGSGGFFNPNDLAALLAPLLVILLAHWVLRSKGDEAIAQRESIGRWSRWLCGSGTKQHLVWAGAVAILAIGLFATGSRSGLLAAAAGALFVAWRKSRKLAAAVVVGVIVASVAIPGIRDRWLGKHDPYAYTRLQIWQQSAELALEHPFGVGLGNYQNAMQRKGVPVEGWVRYERKAHQAHNELITIWVELGWLGLLIALAPLWLFINALWRRRNEPAGPDDFAVHTGALLAVAIPASLSASLHVPPVALLGAVLAARTIRRDPTRGMPFVLRTNRLGRIGVAVAGLFILGISSMATVSHYSMQEAADARDRRELEVASGWAALAELTAPWSLSARMMSESLRFLQGGSRARAVEALLALAVEFPDHPEPLGRAAALLESAAEGSEESIERWRMIARLREEQVRRDSKNAVLRVSLARAYARAGEPDAARASLQAAIQLEPSCANALAHLAAMAAQAGRLDEARELAEAARRADAHAPEHEGYARRVLSLDAVSRNMLGAVESPEP